MFNKNYAFQLVLNYYNEVEQHWLVKDIISRIALFKSSSLCQWIYLSIFYWFSALILLRKYMKANSIITEKLGKFANDTQISRTTIVQTQKISLFFVCTCRHFLPIKRMSSLPLVCQNPPPPNDCSSIASLINDRWSHVL